MKLRLSVHRKAGAPGFGSDGASAEVELDIDDDATATQIATTIAPAWYICLEKAVGDELVRLQAAHPPPSGRPQSLAEGRPMPQPDQQPAPPARQSARAPEAAPEPRRYDPDDVPPRPAQRRPEPGWDDQPEPSPQPPPQNGYGGRNGQRNDEPKNGRQLVPWCKKKGWEERRKILAAAWNLPDFCGDWPADAVAAMVRELTRQSPAAGSWRGN